MAGRMDVSGDPFEAGSWMDAVAGNPRKSRAQRYIIEHRTWRRHPALMEGADASGRSATSYAL